MRFKYIMTQGGPGKSDDFEECMEFMVTFFGIVDEPADWIARATFLNADGNPIADREKRIRIDHFFVLPESTIGAIVQDP